MSVECVGIHHKALNPCKQFKFFTAKASVHSYARVNLYEMSANKSC